MNPDHDFFCSVTPIEGQHLVRLYFDCGHGRRKLWKQATVPEQEQAFELKRTWLCEALGIKPKAATGESV